MKFHGFIAYRHEMKQVYNDLNKRRGYDFVSPLLQLTKTLNKRR